MAVIDCATTLLQVTVHIAAVLLDVGHRCECVGWTMTTTPDNTATTWRDLADQLTPEQVARYERFERELKAGGLPETTTTDALLDYARRDAEGNLADLG